MKLKLLAKQAEQQRKALAAKGKEATKLEAELAASQKKVDAANAKLSSLGFDAAGVEGLEAARVEQQAAVRAHKDTVEALAAKVPRRLEGEEGGWAVRRGDWIGQGHPAGGVVKARKDAARLKPGMQPATAACPRLAARAPPRGTSAPRPWPPSQSAACHPLPLSAPPPPTHPPLSRPPTLQLPASVDFQFRDPEKGFDRERVKGVSGRLIPIERCRPVRAQAPPAGAARSAARRPARCLAGAGPAPGAAR